jgi:hypothetical protein
VNICQFVHQCEGGHTDGYLQFQRQQDYPINLPSSLRKDLEAGAIYSRKQRGLQCAGCYQWTRRSVRIPAENKIQSANCEVWKEPESLTIVRICGQVGVAA